MLKSAFQKINFYIFYQGCQFINHLPPNQLKYIYNHYLSAELQYKRFSVMLKKKWDNLLFDKLLFSFIAELTEVV